jgi:nitroreductase
MEKKNDKKIEESSPSGSTALLQVNDTINRIIDDLNWRYACKVMTGEKVSQEKVNTILNAINLTPTAAGLQAFKVFVIENQEIKERIYSEASPQQPVKGSSHLLVFAAYKDLTPEFLDDFFDLMKRKQSRDEEWMKNYRTSIEGSYFNKPEKTLNRLKNQVYIALGVAVMTAAELRVDCLPMEGFDNSSLDRILNLEEQGLHSVVMLPLGYRDTEKDSYQKLNKMRKDPKDLFEIIK